MALRAQLSGQRVSAVIQCSVTPGAKARCIQWHVEQGSVQYNYCLYGIIMPVGMKNLDSKGVWAKLRNQIPRLKRGLGQATACSKINYSRLQVSRTEGEMVAIRASVRDEQPRRSVKLRF